MKVYFPVLIITVVLLLTGCKKHNESGCVETNHGTTSLTPQELLIQPYGVHDSLVFFNESLNSKISYCCTNQSVSYQTLSENQPDNQGHIACLGNYFKKEVSATPSSTLAHHSKKNTYTIALLGDSMIETLGDPPQFLQKELSKMILFMMEKK